MSKSRKKTRKKAQKKPSFFSALIWVAILLSGLAFAAWVVYLDATIKEKFEGKKWAIPARVYAQPLELYEGLSIKPKVIDNELKSLGYRPVKTVARPGQWSRQGTRYHVYTKGFEFSDKTEVPTQYQFSVIEETIGVLGNAPGHAVLRLEPREIGSIYPGHGEDRILTRLSEIPPLLGETLIAVEDKYFAHHSGLSFKGIARALLANIKAKAWVQGGSTITQQLVKNFYLTHQRSLLRKVQEAVMALLLEWHYSKGEILEAYINEVYLGQSGPRAIHGFGLAANHYFNQPLNKLNTEQIALLVAVVKGASYYNPWRYPERAKARRDLVLKMMANTQLINDDQLAWLVKKPLGIADVSAKQLGDYPAFVDLVKRQLLQDYRIEDLQSEGLRIFTSMSPHIQQQTELAIKNTLNQLDKRSRHDLQSAAIVASVGNGEVVAVVGDRNPRFSGFNRALDASRQIGSLIKPFVYLTALKQPQQYQLSSMLSDRPLTLTLQNGDEWQPNNFSKTSHGDVLLYQALAFSYNQATARLGLELGVDRVVETLKQAGLEKNIDAYPSLLLGAIALSPLEVGQIYHTLAADGVYTPLRAIRSVQDAENQPLQRYPLMSEPRFSIESSHLMHYGLQAAMRIGTGKRAYQQLPANLMVAGKTGTTNKQRDSWFAGYSGDHIGVTWVGNDHNQPTQLTGSSGALIIWSTIFQQLSTKSIAQDTPDTIEYYWIDSQNGWRSAEGCEHTQLIPFVAGTQPEVMSDCEKTNAAKSWWQRWLR